MSLLAVVETAVALIAPTRAPSDADWQGAAAEVRAGFRPGDLVVAAPSWADSILRVHLGDVIPADVAGRLDDERFGRVWEVSQRGARAEEAARGRVLSERRVGRLTVRLIERPAAVVGYDFVARWSDARVSRRASRGADADCEIRAIASSAPASATTSSARRWSRSISACAARCSCSRCRRPPWSSNTRRFVWAARSWWRPGSTTPGCARRRRGPSTSASSSGTEADVSFTTRNEDGWVVRRIDTSARAGKLAVVRFEITSPEPYARHFAFAAEVRE